METKSENELNDLINDKFRQENDGSNSDFFVDDFIRPDTICLNVHVAVLRWMNENIEPHRLMFENICNYLFETQSWLNCITSPFGDKYRSKKEWFGYSKYYEQMKTGVHGSFAQSLAHAWRDAADGNRRKLVEAFPEQFPDGFEYYF